MNKPLTVAIQYPSFGPQHPPRLRAIVATAPHKACRVVAMEMFAKDSDYKWDPVHLGEETFERHTVMDAESAVGRSQFFALRKSVCAALDKINPDVLVVNGWGHKESRISIRWARRKSRPMVVLSDSTRYSVKRYWWKELYKKWVLRGIPAGFAAGTPQACYLERLGIPREGVFYPGPTVVNNAYWAEKSALVRADPETHRKKMGLPPRYFLCVARFIPFKNIPFLVRAFAKYRTYCEGEKYDLVLCGDGQEEAAIRQVIQETGVKGVHLMGFRQVGELPTFFGLSSCGILPSSDCEPWGLVINEAMACGLPVLVSHMVGCSEDLVRYGENGFVFNPRNEEQLARQMVELTRDKERIAQMGEVSRTIVANHSLEIGAKNLWRSVAAATDSDGLMSDG